VSAATWKHGWYLSKD